MNNDIVNLIVELRLLVGFLGEKSQSNWWGSNFIGATSEAFLAPVFSRTILLAQYQGVSEAALIVHDDHIGVGANYHLYRLPDSIERSASKSLADRTNEQQLKTVLENSESALTRLGELASAEASKSEGPNLVGTYSDAGLLDLLAKSASCYLRGFREGYKCFPYMRGNSES